MDPLKILEAAADPTPYLSTITKLAEPIERETVLVDDFLLYKPHNLKIYYAPFDHINAAADVILLGVTPGWTPDPTRICDSTGRSLRPR